MSLASPVLAGGFFTTAPPEKPLLLLPIIYTNIISYLSLVVDLSNKHLSPYPSDQIRSVAQSCPTLCDPMNHSTPGLPVHHQLQEFTQTHIHRVSGPSSHLILCRPLLLLPPIPPSITVFSNESTLRMRCEFWIRTWREEGFDERICLFSYLKTYAAQILL